MRIYLDMDGVLSNLDGDIAREAQIQVADLADTDLRDRLIRDRIRRLGANHWATLEPIHPEVWRRCIAEWSGVAQIEILTSYGHQAQDNGVLAHIGKVRWLRTHFREEMESGAISCFNGVQRCEQKRFFAAPDSYLIDDQENTTRLFKEAGGHSFRYTPGRHAEAEAWVQEALRGKS